MKKLLIIAALSMIFVSCGHGVKKVELADLTLTVKVLDPTGDQIVVDINGIDEPYDLNEAGEVTIKKAQIAPQYSYVLYGSKFYPIYLKGGEPMTITFSGNPDILVVTHQGGAKDINEYLSSEIAGFESTDFYKDEQGVIDATEALLKKNLDNLAKFTTLPEDFVDTEKKRLRYEAYGTWDTYQFSHRWMSGVQDFVPGDLYYKTLSKLIKEDPSVFTLEAYNRLVKKSIKVIAERGLENPLEIATATVNYIVKNYKDTDFRQQLIAYFAESYLKEYGVKDAQSLLDLYNKYITDATLKAKIDGIISIWAAVEPGKPSPLFTYKDQNGVEVSLESMRGNYVFIDIWASWCAPCRREIPALKELEHKFADKPIKFVSISCDSNIEAWRTAMLEEDLEGIQLHTGGNDNFMKSYVVESIPRFILIDKQGAIISSDMSKPTDPKTAETLTELLK